MYIYLLHRTKVIIIIAPSKADITATIAIVNAQPSSLAASEIRHSFFYYIIDVVHIDIIVL